MELKELKLTPKRLEICNRLGLKDSGDIIHYYPYKYEEFVKTPYENFKAGENVFFEGELLNSPSTFRYRGNMSITRFKVLYSEEEINVSIFNRPWVRGMSVNSRITIYGKYEGNNRVTALNYYLKPASEVEGIQTYYPLKEGITNNEIKKLIASVLNKTDKELVDEIPEDILRSHNLIDFKSAILNIHNPVNKEMLRKAFSRLKYEEFLNFFLSINYLKGSSFESGKAAKIFNRKDVDNFISSFNFKFTEDQQKVCDEIINDISANKTMYRLVQGEVGSGKTAIAMVGAYCNCLGGYQSALMAPTEILAKQHYESFKERFNDYPINIELLTSNSKDSEDVRKRLKNGDIDIVIGTHSLFQESVEFKKLGLVIADEQHRFGVKQRRAIKQKGENADFIAMSATPIPRTLASSLYGDMDVSTIATLPRGRKGCDTYLIKKNSIVDILPEIKNKLQEGKQVYIIASAIDHSDNFKGKDATGLYNSLHSVMSPYKLALLHGRLTNEEKDSVMEAFKRNEIQVLVSTTVVEVGVNVKNATVMIIYDADRFGLSQLHQLRGRVQRGDDKGTCYLLTDSKEKEVHERLNVLVNTNDGFEISLQDLKLRGPGDILGTRQSGLPGFILGNLLEDTKFVEAAKSDASKIALELDNRDYQNYFAKIKDRAKKNIID